MECVFDLSGVDDPLTEEELNKWLAALRSGEYEQGRSRLGSNDVCGYCCMGVLNKILDLGVSPHVGFLMKRWTIGDAEVSTYIKLPKSLQSTLADLNDGNRLTFNQIADWIEQNIVV